MINQQTKKDEEKRNENSFVNIQIRYEFLAKKFIPKSKTYANIQYYLEYLSYACT